MDISMQEGVTRPFPVPVRTECASDDQACAFVRLEQARERSSFPYYVAANTVREWRRTAYEAGEACKAATNPFNWLAAAGEQLYAKAEQKLAEWHKAKLVPHLPHEAVMARLGLPVTAATPTCPQAEAAKQNRQPLWRIATAVMAATSLSVTPIRAENLPLTRDQQIELMMRGSICHTAPASATSTAPTPTAPPQAPCCAPKTGVARREKLCVVKGQ